MTIISLLNISLAFLDLARNPNLFQIIRDQISPFAPPFSLLHSIIGYHLSAITYKL